MDSLSASRVPVERLREAVTSNLPVHFLPDGEIRTIYDDSAADDRLIVRIHESHDDARPLGPVLIDAELLSELGTEYALFSIPFVHYKHDTHIVALYGILPLFGMASLYGTPGAVFLLYDCDSGRRVWQSYIGTMSHTGQRAELDLRDLPMAIAGYLLTGDFQAVRDRLRGEVGSGLRRN